MTGMPSPAPLLIHAGDVKPARLLGADLVLWHDGREIHAWLDQCAHRGTKLSLGKVRDQQLVCAYHGWCYDDSGMCTLVPAHPDETKSFGAKARVYRAQVKYGLVWVCLGMPAQPVPSFPEGDDPSFRQVLAGPYRFNAYATRVLENFLDAGHYPFLHSSQMAAGTRYEMEKYDVQSTSDGPAAKDILTHRIWREGPNGTGEVDVTYSFHVLRPLTAHYTKAYKNERFAMMDTVTPVDEAESLVWSIMALNYSTGNSDASAARLSGHVNPAGHSHRRIAAPATSAARSSARNSHAFRQTGGRLSPVAQKTGIEIRHLVGRQPHSEASPNSAAALASANASGCARRLKSFPEASMPNSSKPAKMYGR